MQVNSLQFEQSYLTNFANPSTKQKHKQQYDNQHHSAPAPSIKNQEIMRLQVSFPSKLYNLLESTDKDIIDWLPNEKAFCVHDMQRFVTLVLPQYFNRKFYIFSLYTITSYITHHIHILIIYFFLLFLSLDSKFGSFQRQLNTYGFKRILRGYHLGAYFHPDFQKGRLDLLSKIKRIVPTKTPVCGEMLNLEVDAPSPSGEQNRKRMKSGSMSAPVSPSPAWGSHLGFQFDMPKPAYSQYELSTSYDSYATDNSQSSYNYNSNMGSNSNSHSCNDNGVLQSSSYDVDANRSVKIQYQDGTFNGITEITIDPNVLSTFGEIYYLPNQGGRPIRIKAVPLLSAIAPATSEPVIAAPVTNSGPVNYDTGVVFHEATFTNFNPETDLLDVLDDRAVPSSSCSISSEPSDITLEEQKPPGTSL